MKCTLLLLALLLLTSCATVLNEDSRLIYFYSSKNLEKIKVKDSIYELPVQLNLARSKEDLKVVMVTDSTDLNYTIKAHLDNKFLALNLTGLVFAPVNYAVDLTNHRRFEYPRIVYLDPMMADGMPIKEEEYFSNRRDKYLNGKVGDKKGRLYLFGTIIPFNYTSLAIPGLVGTQKGIGTGVGELGFTYYHSKRSYLNLGAGLTTRMIFFPIVATGYSTAYTLTLSNFHQLDYLHLGYGAFWGHTRNSEDVGKNNHEMIVDNNHYTVGVMVAAHLEVAKNFYIGFSYKPSLYRVSTPKEWVSNHVFNLELTYKLKLLGK